mgnify:CR=1 FL=1
MGPRHLSRGISYLAFARADANGASMGPRHLSRGIIRSAGTFGTEEDELQWGHGI